MIVKRKMEVFVLTIFLFVVCTAEDQLNSGYIFTARRTFRHPGNNEMLLCREGELQGGDVIRVKMYTMESYSGNETLKKEQEYHLEKGKKCTPLNFPLGQFDSENIYNGKLEIEGTIAGECIGGKDNINFFNPKPYIVIIQTDKPLYKPGQTMKFRILKLDKHLKPSGDENDFGDVYIEDPKGTRLAQFYKVQMGKGITQLEFTLSDEPPLGNWRIIVSYNNVTESQTFEVKEYVLPKFDVKIEFPPFVLANAEIIPIKMCAKYTYGKSVKGNLTFQLSMETYSYSRDKTPTIEVSVQIDGCYNYTLNVSQIEPDNAYRYRRIMCKASMIEKGTGVQRNATEYLQRQYLPLNLNFNTDQNYRQYFKPGLPYKGKLKVTNPDDSPAPEEPIQICCTVSRKRIRGKWLMANKVKYCRNFTSDAKGYIKYTIPPQSTDAESIQLEAKSLKYARDSTNSGSRLDILNQPSTGMSLNPFYSPSGSFIQLETIGSPLPCETEQHIKLLHTAYKTENTEFNLRYEIRRQGNLIETGYKKVNFNIKDDVSKNFQNEDELIDESETQIVPEPKSTSTSDTDSSDDENCQSDKDIKYIPPIGEVYIPISVSADMSPSITLLVYYVKDDTETVADSQKIEVEKCFKNKVDFQFGDEVKQPGTKTSITVQSSPNSLCGLKIVDKSVSLLNSKDTLTKEKIFQLIENFDSNSYYGGNPCNQDTPQPGLYSTKSANIIRPPGRWTSSNYQDSLTAFLDCGLLVISNLKLFTRPCTSGGGYGDGPVYQMESFSGNGVRFKKKGHAVALASTARRPAAPAAAAGFAADKMGDISTKSAVEVRDYFPETWLFELQATDADGMYVKKETLPHTITEWVGSAVCVNAEDGLGLSNTTSIKGFQAFFISTTLPYSVKRGEIVTIVVSVFSYVNEALPITVTLDESKDYEVVGDSVNREICVDPGTSHNMPIKMKTTKVGTVNITIRAATAESNDVCGDSPVYEGGLAKDAVTQTLESEAEGYLVQKVDSILFCPTEEEDQTFRSSLNIDLPDNVVPDSQRAIVDVTGNVMGPAIENLDSLVSLPTGCGEQNMVKFTPNYLVLDYLNDIGKLSDQIKSKAIKNLNTGYQRELTYRHDDGSFSAFGKVDREGSMFLTAFVLKSFYEARRHMTIDESVITACQKWIISKQQADGCFPNVGKIVDRGIQGGLEKEKNLGAITAYVAIALVVSKCENETVIENAMSCLSQDTDGSYYNKFLYAYAEALAGKTEVAMKRIDDMKPLANTTDGVEYYRNPNGTQSLDLETAAYAVLAQKELGKSATDMLGLVRYMSQNLNPRGGFYSTQDTCVGLDALSKFAKDIYKEPIDMEVTLKGAIDKTIDISEENRILVQRTLVTDIPGELNVEASGSGCGLIQVALRYNTETPPERQSFYLECVGECLDSDCNQRQITAITNYLPPQKAAGMTVLEINMITGTVPDKESLDKLKADKTNLILRVDVEGNKVVIYFSEVTNNFQRITFLCRKVVEVDNPQPATAKVYDYYNPEKAASTSYSFGNSDYSASSPNSGSTEP